MARPLKNNADYFSHDNNMRNDTKILALRAKFGFEGYAIWGMLLEVLTEAEEFKISLSNLEMELLAGDFRIDSNKLKDIVKYLVEIELLTNDYDTKIYYSKSLIKRLQPVIDNRERKREWADKRWEKESKTGLKTSETELPTSKTMQSKVKESKVKESKENKEKTKVFSTPVVSQNSSPLEEEISYVAVDDNGEEIVKPEKPKKKKMQNQEVKEIIGRYLSRFKYISGKEGVYNEADYYRVAKLLKAKQLSKEKICAMIEWYVSYDNDKFKQHPSLKSIFTVENLNKFNLNN